MPKKNALPPPAGDPEAQAQRTETLGRARRLHEYREVAAAYYDARRLLDELATAPDPDGDDGEGAG
ncbi:hypothetical protein [Nocardiopsis composta]|uniref:Uncharacterized protein n=1 Tax=Nocardiopsis composta TaxID=157465 RepID=A0A7W8QGB8_9ACTN|nr:hypothetical protein [Nocardiopsis composta]MBB5429943.1 hypothetical protein [Nocardiopsis composta]